MTLTEDMKQVVHRVRLGFVATVCADGTPNLSPKGTLSVADDEHLVFADLRSPGTIANLRSNSSIEINVVDVFNRKGYRFKGVAEVYERGSVFDRFVELFNRGRLADTPRHIRSVVLIRVVTALPLVSPGYDGGKTEQDMIGEWQAYYRGTHAPPEITS